MERERLTITLRKDILKLVDQSIDGAKLRNRSHAIEYFLSQQLTPKTVRVVLVMESTAPKTTYQAGGMPVGIRGTIGAEIDLKPIFQTLSSQGFNEIIIAGPDSPALQASVVDAEKYDISARTLPISAEGGSVGDLVINQLRETMQEESFILWDARFTSAIDLFSLLDFHKNSRAVGTAALSSNTRDEFTGFKAQLLGSQVVAVGTKETIPEGGLPLVGIYVFEPSVFNGSVDGKKSFYREILPQLARAGRLSGYVFNTSAVLRQPVISRARQT